MQDQPASVSLPILSSWILNLGSVSGKGDMLVQLGEKELKLV